MSILDNTTEVDEAKARLRALPDERLLLDLRYWSVAAGDAGEDYLRAHERLAEIRTLYSEAQQWVGLVTQEIRSRRPHIDRPRSGQEEIEP